MDPVVSQALESIRQGTPARELESDRIEFKQEDPDLRRTLQIAADAVVCLANSEGGFIVLGIPDTAAGPGRGIGLSAGLTADSLRRGVYDRTRPGLSVAVEESNFDGARILIITVPQGATFYANTAGTATRRLGSTCVPFTPEEQRQAAASRGYTDWSAEDSGLGIDALGDDEIRRARRLLTLAGRDDLAKADESQLLRDLRLVTDRGQVTRAGLLVLGRESEIQAAIPSYGYAYQYRPSPGSESTARLRGSRPILAAVELLLDGIATRSQVHAISLEGGVQLQIRDYPPEAIREVVVNALVHRDYEAGAAVEIEHSPESLTVTSPGGLVFGVTPDNILTHPSTPRHRLLLETVTLLQVAERTGQGIDRAYRELLRAGKAPPLITDDGLQVRVVVQGGMGNDAFARFAANLEVELGRDVDVLLALSHLRDRRSLDVSELAKISQRSVAEAREVLGRVESAGLIEPTRRSARRENPTYVLTGEGLSRLGRAVTYYYRRTDDTDRKILDHVAEYGYITNQTVRRLFNVDLYTSRNLLQRLRDQGRLVKLDVGRGGPGIRYGPSGNARGGARRSPTVAKGPTQIEAGADQLELPDPSDASETRKPM